MNSTELELKKFNEIVTKIKYGILITHDDKDQLKGRPMQTAEIDENGIIWFFTNEFSEKTKNISKNNQVFLNYSEPSLNCYLVINGDASLNDDKNKIKDLWSPSFKLWFSKGLDDPDLMLIKIIPRQVEYWDNSASRIVIFFNRVKSILKGQHFEEGEHKKIGVQG